LLAVTCGDACAVIACMPAIVASGLVTSQSGNSRVLFAANRLGDLLAVPGWVLGPGASANSTGCLDFFRVSPARGRAIHLAVPCRATGHRRRLSHAAGTLDDRVGLYSLPDWTGRNGRGERYPGSTGKGSAILTAQARPLSSSPITRREWVALAAILILATLLRVGWPTLVEFKFSEARLIALVLELTREGHLPLVGVPSSAGFDHSPFSVYLYIPPLLFTTDPVPAIIYGGLVNVAAVALSWWLCRKWAGGGPWAALVATLLFAISPWSVAFSRKIWQVAFVSILALGFIGLVVSALVYGRRWALAWALAVYAVLVQVHPSAVSLAPALLLWLVLFRHRIRLGPLLAGAALSVLSSTPFLLHQAQNGWPALAALRSWLPAKWDFSAWSLMWEAVTGRSIHALAGEAYSQLEIVPQLGWAFNVIGWLAVGSALFLAWRMLANWRSAQEVEQCRARIDLVLLSWLVVPIIFNLRHSLELHLHFFVVVMPAAYLLSGRAVEAILHVKRNAKIVAWFHAAILLGAGLLTAAQLVALVLMGRFVATHDTAGGFGTPLSQYQTVVDRVTAMAAEEAVAEILVIGQGDSIVVDEVPAVFDVLLRGRVLYRFVDGQSAALFPLHRALVLLTPQAGEAADWYRRRPATQIAVDPAMPGIYSAVTLDGSWPQADFQPVAGPRLFGNGVELQGYADQIQPGQPARLWLLWQVLWPSSEDTHFSVQVIGAEGDRWGQEDKVGYPTAYRQKGDRVISQFDITPIDRAPTGQHWARVSLYTYPVMIDVPVIDGSGHPIADAVILGPLGKESP
jgi:hypothetical protein